MPGRSLEVTTTAIRRQHDHSSIPQHCLLYTAALQDVLYLLLAIVPMSTWLSICTSFTSWYCIKTINNAN